MQKITFVTGNKRKVGEARSACDLFDIEVVQREFAIDEIQSLDPIKIAEHKANVAFELAAEPIVINDAFWSIPALQGFPGGYMKDVTEWFSTDDFLALMRNKSDRSAVITECVIYKDLKTTKLFTKEYQGIFSDKPSGDGVSIEQLIIINGKTIAEHHNAGDYSIKAEDQVWYDFAKWFIKKESR